MGKSTLFNRLIHQRKAIVDDYPGVTRDRHYAEAQWADREFFLMDTGGYVPDSRELFNVAIREQVQLALEEADLILMIGDATTGVTDVDELMARMIRDTKRPYLLLVNKADNEERELAVGEFWSLGLDEPLPVSAISGRHTGDILDRVVELLPAHGRHHLEGDLRLAIIGRPNVGKSSLVNKLLGESRILVTPIAGTTRDSIDSLVNHEGRRYVLVDTAGLRRRTRISENVEFYAGLRSRAAMESADVCVLLLDSEEGLTRQDIQVLEEAVKLRKGVLLAVNKWDLVPDKETNTARDYEQRIREQVPTLHWIQVVFISALTGQRARRVLDMAWEIHERCITHFDRDELCEKMLPEVEKRPPAARLGKWIRITDVRQFRDNPPWFLFSCNYPDLLDESYKRFLENRLRKHFNLDGVPVRLDFRRASQIRDMLAQEEQENAAHDGFTLPPGVERRQSAGGWAVAYQGEADDDEDDDSWQDDDED